MRRAFLRASAALFAAAAIATVCSVSTTACLSPTLPLPPPEQPHTMRELPNGSWEISGECTPGALVTILNERTGIGAAQEDRDDDGRYTIRLDASPCDVASVWQALGDDESTATRFIVTERSPSLPGDPGTCR